jgi:hypothetical protein
MMARKEFDRFLLFFIVSFLALDPACYAMWEPTIMLLTRLLVCNAEPDHFRNRREAFPALLALLDAT